MSDWKARMPRQLPETGTSHIVVAVKNDDGGRLEFTGQVSKEMAAKIWASVLNEELEEKVR